MESSQEIIRNFEENLKNVCRKSKELVRMKRRSHSSVNLLKNENENHPLKIFLEKKGSEKDYLIFLKNFEHVFNCNGLKTQWGQWASTLGMNHPPGISHYASFAGANIFCKYFLVSIRVETNGYKFCKTAYEGVSNDLCFTLKGEQI